MFNFNDKRFDFWPVYYAIRNIYPIGIERNEVDLFLKFAGKQELEDLIVDNIHNETNFHSRWETFEARLAEATGKQVTGTTYGQAPSFSANIELETIELPDRTIFKEVYFAVSLIGPFYTVLGRDRSLVRLSEHRFYGGTNYLVVSPEDEYRTLFELVCLNIEQQFKGYRFVPFEILTQRLKGLSVYYSDEPADKIFDALFNQQVDLSAQYIGDTFHKYSDWKVSF